MAVLEMVKPVIEYWDAWDREMGAPPIFAHPDEYDQWLASISEGWCPPDHPDGNQHRLERITDPETGNHWLRCEHGTWFRFIQPNQIEGD